MHDGGTEAVLRRLPLLSAEALPNVGKDHLTKGLVRVTMACNERCPFCNVPVEDYAHPTPPESELLREVDAFIASGERTLTISGGEPTLYRERLAVVIGRARAAGVPYVELQTNAVLIDADYARELASAGLTSAFVSLLAHRADLHDHLAGLNGAFEPCLRGIDALIDAGVLVTLNPVIAASTAAHVSAYVDFVAERLPRVRTISLSAVQPHGRAAHALELLPDYAVLGPEVRRARERARAHDIQLINPYCGVPLCVGWEEHADLSVEAVEASARRESAKERRAHGIENRGNKRHGEPCRRCALRTHCGGAWHAYWYARHGSGIEAPLERIEPWDARARAAPGQRVVAAREDIDDSTLAALAAESAPTLWLLVTRLARGDGERVLGAGCSDLALLVDAPGLLSDGATLDELGAVCAKNAELEPQARLRVAVGIRRLGTFAQAYRALSLLREAGVESVRLLVKGDERHERFVALARAELDLDISLAEPPA